jgi:hypothetical protein
VDVLRIVKYFILERVVLLLLFLQVVVAFAVDRRLAVLLVFGLFVSGLLLFLLLFLLLLLELPLSLLPQPLLLQLLRLLFFLLRVDVEQVMSVGSLATRFESLLRKGHGLLVVLVVDGLASRILG